MIKLSTRLEAISSLVPNKSKVIDVGCDHGLLDIYLYQKKISDKIIASDINENALKNAKENIEKNKLEKLIETRLGNGLDTLYETDEIDTIIISGMGAHTAVDILKNNLQKLEKIKTIIIQSNTKLEFLRKEIIKINYLIEDEILIEDNKKIYTIIKFRKGKKKYSKKELYFGPILLKKNTKLFQNNNKLELEKLYLLLKLLPKNKIIDRYKIKKKISMYE
ncbi:MAG: SAM-dependent methyltransferase [Bacilli bacterium]|nr:SAM-dependent methyltransferase [Bacilli bacterium]